LTGLSFMKKLQAEPGEPFQFDPRMFGR